jgi:ADP-heptose:LPS heptosyltransferase|tara:strand:- start:7812 stop:8783 length:972 start_codon:yes stop_codon:yes gene_type:complete
MKNNILIIRNFNLGDIIVSISALRYIKKKFSNEKITLLTFNKLNNYNEYLKLINSDKKVIDEIIYINFNGLFNIRQNYKNFIFLRKFSEIIYLTDESRSLYKRIRNYLLLHLVNTKNNIKIFDKKKYSNNKNEAFILAQKINKELTQLKFLNEYKIKKKFKIKNHEIKKKIKNNYEYITISFGGESSPVKWKLSNWKLLFKYFEQYPKIKIILVGNQNDYILSKKFMFVSKVQVINFCGITSILDTCYLIQNSKLHISNDNGSMHLANILGTKTISLFHTHNPKGKWESLDKKSIKLRNKDGINSISIYKLIKNIDNLKILIT